MQSSANRPSDEPAPESAAAEQAADEDSDRLMHSLEHESDSLWKQNPVLAIATLTLPIWLSGVILAAAFVTGGAALVRKLVVATVAAAAAGRFVILGGKADHPAGFTALELAALVLYLDTIWAIVLAYHVGALFRLPWIGMRLKAAVQEGRLLLKKNRWMRNVTVGAVAAFVMLPISSTGSIGGSLLGRLLGLSRVATLSVVLLASVAGEPSCTSAREL
ncbi:MAG: hypothetical protein R3C19_18845 [Planctomycetaceae bacterium]